MDTGKIKQRLNRHRKMVEDCEALRRELDFAIEKYGAVGGAGLDAIPSGCRTTGNGKIERQVIRKIELEERLSERELEVAADWRELEPLVNRLEPMEGLVIRLRYYYAKIFTGKGIASRTKPRLIRTECSSCMAGRCCHLPNWRRRNGKFRKKIWNFPKNVSK